MLASLRGASTWVVVCASGMGGCALLTDLDALSSQPDVGGLDGAAADISTFDPSDAGSPSKSCAEAGPQSWMATPPGPLPGRDEAAIFWTGSDFLVFGGTEWGAQTALEVTDDGGIPVVADGGWPLGCGYGWVGNTCSDGARYNPTNQTWTSISNVGSPQPFRWDMSFAYGNGQLFTFSGHGVSDGGWLYDVASDTWKSVSMVNAPTVRAYHASYFVNGKFLVWGGQSVDAADAAVPGGTPLSSGGYYDPVTDAWSPINSGPFSATAYFAAASSDAKLFVWGGTSDPTPWIPVVDGVTNAGAIYDYATNAWKSTSTVDAPSPRMYAAAVWTGSKFVVFGGEGANKSFNYNDGAMYDPVSDTWTPMATAGAPQSLFPNMMVWTGSRVLLWGTAGHIDGPPVSAIGALFDPVANAWDAPITLTSAPSFTTAGVVGNTYQYPWNGSQLFVWGGQLADGGGTWTFPNAGALYTPPCAL